MNKAQNIPQCIPQQMTQRSAHAPSVAMRCYRFTLVVISLSMLFGAIKITKADAMVPVGGYSGNIVVISEQAKAWPRTLTPWEQTHKAQCAVMGLKITAASLPAFMTSTRGMAFRYASPLDDNWSTGQSAYTSLTPHFGRLFE